MTGIEDVARAAGVSTATVSRALSGRGRVSDATRDRVRGIAADLGYVASAAASGLASGRTSSIGVLLPMLDRWFFAQVLEGIAAVLTPRGYDITLYCVSDEPAQRAHLLGTSLRRGRVDGLIAVNTPLTADEVGEVLATGLPVVGLGVTDPRWATLAVDDVAVARLATEHLLSLGHRRIAHLGAGEATGADVPSQRRRGFTAAVADAGGTAEFVPAAYTIDGGYRAARQVLAAPDRPSAIFAASDEMAFGAVFAARELGLSIPRDVAIVGVDGHEQSALFDLTTVEQFPRAQGVRAAETVLARLDGASVRPELPFQLVERGSTVAADRA